MVPDLNASHVEDVASSSCAVGALAFLIDNLSDTGLHDQLGALAAWEKRDVDSRRRR